MKKFGILAIMCLLLAGLAACGSGGGNIEEFTGKVAGVWYLNANLLDEKLEISEDGSYTYEQADGTVEQGTIGYDEEHKTFQFVVGNTMYSIELKEGEPEILYYQENFYREQDSVSGFEEYNGDWYLDGDTNGNYYRIEDGVWSYFESQGQGAVSTTTGNLEWDNANAKLILREYPEDDPIGESDIATGELTSGAETYILMEDASADAESGEYSGDEEYAEEESAVSGETGLVFYSYYYMDGNIEEGSLYFYEDETVDYDSPGSSTEAGTWVLEGDTLYVTLMGQEQSYTVEEGALVLPDGQRLLLESASSADEGSGESALLATGEYYCVYGDLAQPSWFFFEEYEGSTICHYEEGATTAEYTYSIAQGNIIVVTDSDGEVYTNLMINDDGSIIDLADAVVYRLPE